MRTAAHMPSLADGEEEAAAGVPEASPGTEGCEVCTGDGEASAGVAGCEACAGWEVASVETVDESLFLERLDLRLMKRRAPRAGADATSRARR